MRALLLTAILALTLTLWAQVDPLIASKEVVKHAPGKFVALSGHEISPVVRWSRRIIAASDWPSIKSPVDINRSFKRPDEVWAAPGGYFAIFDPGELGEALFYAVEGADVWTPILEGNVQSLGQFSDSAYLAVGGLSHKISSGGAVHLITRQADGIWSARTLMESAWGVPRLIGETTTSVDSRPMKPRLLVVAITDPMDDRAEQLFGFDVAGTSFYIGPRPKGEQACAGQPATAPESKSDGGDKPQPEAEGRSR
jgi:hypothetical protein